MERRSGSTEGQDPPLSRKPRRVKFFKLTGTSMFCPNSYTMREYQKQIIQTCFWNNTLISLPTGLGMSYIGTLLIYNFNRWFLESKIIILSPNKSAIMEQISAINSYTMLPKEWYSDLHGNAPAKEEADKPSWNNSIILTSPQKFLENMGSACEVHDMILLVIHETKKIKCAEYKEIMNRLKEIQFRVLLFLENVGFNSNTLTEIIETFNISKIEIRNINSSDIRECTYNSEIESVYLDISKEIGNIKDNFFKVYEKYCKLLKEWKVIAGNVTSFTKAELEKKRTDLNKNPPPNLTPEIRKQLLNSLTMCSFLRHGTALLHNWGIKAFYNYLFDETKGDELKTLIVEDEKLMDEMKSLNEYLKKHGKMFHPKLVYLQKLITNTFSSTKSVQQLRIVIVCSNETVICELDRLLLELPNYVKHYCVKTKVKSLTEAEHKELMKNFHNGKINILVAPNLTNEILELKSSLIISLEPNKNLLKCADPRFNEGPAKCLFILSRGEEIHKHELALKEKDKEYKFTNMCQTFKESPGIFPEDFSPEIQMMGVASVSKPSKLPAQKSMSHNLKSSNENVFDPISLLDGENSLFLSDTDEEIVVNVNGRKSSITALSLFSDDEDDANATSITNNFLNNSSPLASQQFYDDEPIMLNSPPKCVEKFDSMDDSFNDLLLDFSITNTNNNTVKNQKTGSKKDIAQPTFPGSPSDKENEYTCFNRDSSIVSARVKSLKSNSSDISILCKSPLLLNQETRSSRDSTSPIFPPKRSLQSACDFFTLKDKSDSINFDSSFDISNMNLSKLITQPDACATKDAVEPAEHATIETQKDCDRLSTISAEPVKDPSKVEDDGYNSDPELLFEDEGSFEDAVGNFVTPNGNTSTPLASGGNSNVKNSDDTPKLMQSPVISSGRRMRSGETKQEESPVLDKTIRWDSRSDTGSPKINVKLRRNIFSNFSQTLKQSIEKFSQQESINKVTEDDKKCVNGLIEDDEEEDVVFHKPNARVRLRDLESDDDDEEVNPWQKKNRVGLRDLESDDDDGDVYPWQKKNPVKRKVTNAIEFKEPKTSTKSYNSGGTTNSSSNVKSRNGSRTTSRSVLRDRTPEARLNRKRRKMDIGNNNLAKEFIDDEAEVSSDDGADDDDDQTICDNSRDLTDSFVDDETFVKGSNYSHYLRHRKSPEGGQGKYLIKYTKRLARADVMSQYEEYEEDYDESDSFIASNSEVEYIDDDVPDSLTQIVHRLEVQEAMERNRRRRVVSSFSDSDTE